MRSNSVTAAIRFLLYFAILRSLAWSSRSRVHALTRLTRHGDGAGNVTLHRSDSLHSTSHVAEPAEGSVRPHPLLAGELIDQGKKIRRDTSGSQIAGQRQDGKPTTHQPPRESESRQTDRQTEQAATPTPIRHLSGRVPHPKIRRGAPVPAHAPGRRFCALPPIRHLVVRVRVQKRVYKGRLADSARLDKTIIFLTPRGEKSALN